MFQSLATRTLLHTPVVARRFFAANVFDRKMKLAQRQRAAVDPESRSFDYLKEEVALRLIDRLDDIKREFPIAADVGAGVGLIAKHLENKGGVKSLTMVEMSDKMLYRDKEIHDKAGYPFKLHYLEADEETVELEQGKYDLIISNMSLHWINDLPATLTRIRKALKPDGCFLASMLGGETLQELRSSFAVADMERYGGVSPHVSPFAHGRDIGDVLTRAGFTIPTIDSDSLVVKYPDMFTLCEHLRGMAENNCVHDRSPSVSRDVFLSAAATYQELYTSPEDGLLDATFQVFYMIGWAPHYSQPKAAARGSASVRIGELPPQEAAPKAKQPEPPITMYNTATLTPEQLEQIRNASFHGDGEKDKKQ